MLDDTTPFQDYSGYGRAGVMDTGSPTTATSLVAGALFSQVFSNAVDAKFDTPVYVQGYELQPFTLEASFRVIDESGTGSIQKVLGTASNYDGITVNGTIIKFSTKYLTAGECGVSYDIQTKRNVHVIGVHTNDKNQLYIDGVLVGETLMTDAQRIDSYVATDGKLWLGTSASAQKVAVNGVAIYAHPLNDVSVKNHFNASRRTILSTAIAPPIGGVRLPMNINMSDIFLRQVWATKDDWNLGTKSQVSIVDDRLVPQLVVGISVAGNWQSMTTLDCGKTSVYGLSFDWDGFGAVVEASLDGTTWETAVRGKKLALIPNAFNPTAKDLFIRISFPGSIADDPSYMDNFTVTGLTTGVQPDVAGRIVTLTDPASPMNDYEPIELRDDFGVRLSTGTVVISADSNTSPPAIFSMNVWLKKLTATDPTFSITGTTNYKNGAVAGTMNQGEWVMWTMTKATALTGAITISGDVQVGQVELFTSQLSAQQVADLYTASTGVPVFKAPDTNTITITNPNPSTKLYDYDWSITGAGG